MRLRPDIAEPVIVVEMRTLSSLWRDRMPRWARRWGRPNHMVFGDHAVARTCRGDLIVVSPRDLGTAPSLIFNGVWEAHIERVLERILLPGMTVVELGANVGYHTLGMARAVGPRGHVHAFEANPEVAKLLAMTLGRSALGRRVTMRNVAVSDEAGSVQLLCDPTNDASGHLAWAGAGELYSRRYDVAAVTLDEALADLPSVDLLRMDIEGAEGLALIGAQALVRRSPRLHIVTEWSPMQMRVRSDVDGVVERLKSWGFTARVIAGRRLVTVDMDRLPTLDHADLLLSRRSGRGAWRDSGASRGRISRTGRQAGQHPPPAASR